MPAWPENAEYVPTMDLRDWALCDPSNCVYTNGVINVGAGATGHQNAPIATSQQQCLLLLEAFASSANTAGAGNFQFAVSYAPNTGGVGALALGPFSDIVNAAGLAIAASKRDSLVVIPPGSGLGIYVLKNGLGAAINVTLNVRYVPVAM